MSADSSDSKDHFSIKRDSPNKPKEIVENVLDDIMGEDVNFEDFEDDVDQKHVQTENGKQTSYVSQRTELDRAASQKESKKTNADPERDKQSSTQLRSLTSLESDKAIDKTKVIQENSDISTKEKESHDNEKITPNTKVDKAPAISSKPSRYFIIKSNNYEHLEISMRKSIWSTQPHNEQKLNEAFEVPTLA